MIVGPKSQNLHGQLRLSETTDTVILDADTYTKVSGTFTDGHVSGFTVSNNKLIFNGPDGSCFLFNGASDLESNKSCIIFYALYLNGQLVNDAQTPHKFVTPSKTTSIGITSIIKLNNGDELEIYCKSSETNTTLTIKNLNITFWGH